MVRFWQNTTFIIVKCLFRSKVSQIALIKNLKKKKRLKKKKSVNSNFQFLPFQKSFEQKKVFFFFFLSFSGKKSAFLVIPDIINGFSDSFPFQTVHLNSNHSNSLKVTALQISNFFGLTLL